VIGEFRFKRIRARCGGAAKAAGAAAARCVGNRRLRERRRSCACLRGERQHREDIRAFQLRGGLLLGVRIPNTRTTMLRCHGLWRFRRSLERCPRLARRLQKSGSCGDCTICSSRSLDRSSDSRTDAWPESASPILRRKSSRVEMAMISGPPGGARGCVEPASLPQSGGPIRCWGTGQQDNSLKFVSGPVRLCPGTRKRRAAR